MTLVVVLGVAFFAASASRRVAEDQAVAVAAERANLLAQLVVQPALTDGVLTQDRAAVARLAMAVRQHLDGMQVTRIKFWTADGLLVYSSNPRLIGQRFPLSADHRAVLADGRLRAVVADLDEPENASERGEAKLLEVHRLVRTPGGQPLVMETYWGYSTVDRATAKLWRDFAPVTLASLAALLLLLLPVLWHLLRRLRDAQAQREALLERAVRASTEERRRIAATLHDGVVQDLIGASMAVSSAAMRAKARGLPEVSAEMSAATSTVRTSIGGLRSLLADIYPPSLDAAGLETALRDLVASSRTRDVDVSFACRYSRWSGLTQHQERLLFRIAHECLNNAVRHAAAAHIEISLVEDEGVVVLDVVDDGRGFDAEVLVKEPKEGHFGLRLIADAAREAGAELKVASAPGAGTHWRLRATRR